MEQDGDSCTVRGKNGVVRKEQWQQLLDKSENTVDQQMIDFDKSEKTVNRHMIEKTVSRR